MDDADDALCHYGKKDMHWGTRLYQNLDGSLTPLGRLHYGIGFKNIGQVEAARRAKEKAKKEKEEAERKKAEEARQQAIEKVTRSGNVEDIYRLRETMTDEELNRAVRRMQSTQQLETALRSIENRRMDSIKPEVKFEAPKAKEPKKSIFEKAREKKEEKARREQEEKAEKERKAKEAFNKGLDIINTAAKAGNSIASAYMSYNKVASIINTVGGDEKLPTWSQNPWTTPNGGKTSKAEKAISDALKSVSESGSNKEIGKKDWSVKSTYKVQEPSSGISISDGPSWDSKKTDKQHTSSPFTGSTKKDWTTSTPSHTSNPFTGSTKKDWTVSTPSHTSSPFTGSKNSYWTTSTPSHTSSPFSGSSSKGWTDSKKSSKSSDPLVSILDSFTSPGSYSTTQITEAIKNGASLASIEKMTSGYSASDARKYCDSFVSSYSVESGWDKWKKSSSGFIHSDEEDLEDDVLCHYGRKEQKWGVRRYQNLDGSLTEEGRIRYSKARKKYGMDDPNLSDRKRAKQLTLASDMLRSNRKALSTLEHPSDNELRRTIETSVNPYLHPSTLASAYGGAMVGGPIGAAVAGSIKANRVQADVANKVVMGREILDRYMKDPEYYSKSMYAVPLIDQRYINEGRGFIEKLSKSGSLQHSGIKGMKWGIRRFQNLDGSLTEAGKERYQKKRSEYGLDRDPSELTKAQRSKQIGAAYRYAIEQRHTDDLDLFDDNDLRRLSEADYKKGKAYEMGSRVVVSALAGVGGLAISGGNPAAGLASASATFALNTARSAIRDASGTRAADYTNDLVIGREALNKLMENPDVYNFDMEKALGNYERSVQRGTAWDYKSGRGK